MAHPLKVCVIFTHAFRNIQEYFRIQEYTMLVFVFVCVFISLCSERKAGRAVLF